MDLGTRTTKAIHLQRKGDVYTLLGYVLAETPDAEKGLSAAALGEHLKAVMLKLGGKCKQLALAVGVGDSLVRLAEMPLVPLSDLRMMLKLHPKNYLQQEVVDHVFDCHILPLGMEAKPDTAKGPPKCKVLVAGARRQYVEELQEAARSAGLSLEHVVPGLIGPINAFEQVQPEVCAKEVVALVDIGYRNSSTTILQAGEVKLSRVVNLGADRITSGLADSLGVSYAEAESIKVGLPQEVQSALQTLLGALGRELRASIDFFEHQEDRTVSQVLLSGGSARSDAMMQMLQAELMVPCKSWDPTKSFRLQLPAAQTADLETTVPQLTVAVGTALGAF